MANLGAALAALSPEHYWLMDDDDTEYTDSGSGNIPLTPDTPNGVIFRNVGAVKGAPRVGGTWVHPGSGQNDDGSWSALSGPDSSGWDTGAIGAFFYIANTVSSGNELVVFDMEYGGNRYARITITNDLGIRFNLNGDISGVVTSLANVVSPNQRHSVCVIQRGDGNGPRLLLDQADVTDMISGAIGVDDWFDEVFTSVTAPVRMQVGRGGSQTTQPAFGIISAPYVLVNNEPADDQTIFDLYDSAELNPAIPASDYMELMLSCFGDEFLWLGQAVEASGQNAYTSVANSNYTAPAQLISRANAAGFEDDTEVVTQYRKRNLNASASGQLSSYIDNSGNLGGPVRATGTLTVLFRTAALNNAVKHVLFASGNANSSAAQAAMEIHVTAAPMGFTTGTLIYEFQDGPGGNLLTQWRPGLGTIPINSPLTMFTIVQNGSDLAFYINGERVGGEYVVDTAPRSNWFDTIDASLSGTGTFKIARQWNDSVSTDAFEGFAHHVGISRDIFSASEVSALWDAVNGRFAALPDNRYVETLLSYNPTHFWQLDEASGSTFADVGDAPTKMPLTRIGLGYIHRRPGPIRGRPRVYAFQVLGSGFYTTQPSGLRSVSNFGEFTNANSIGALGMVGTVWGTANTTVLMQCNSSNVANGFTLRVENDQSVYFRIGEGSDDLEIQTAPGAVVQGEPFNVAVVQDGVAIKIYLNGIDTGATVTLSGNATAGSWMADLWTLAITYFGIINFDGDTSNPYATDPDPASLQGPWYMAGKVVTAEQLVALTTACNFNGTPTDYYEAIDRLTRGTRRWWQIHNTVQSSGSNPMLNHGDVNQNNSRFFYNPDWFNVSSIQPDTKIVSDFNCVVARWTDASNAPAEAISSAAIPAGPESPWFQTDGVGSLVFMVDMIDNIANGEQRHLFYYSLGGVGVFRFYITTSTITTPLKLIIEDSVGAVLTDITTDSIYPAGSTPGLLQIALVQNGNGVKFYIDDNEINIFSNVGSTDDVLFNGLASTAANNASRIFSQSIFGTINFGNNRTITSFMTTNVLTATELGLIRDAYDGIFTGFGPNNGLAPPNGFYNTLITTGNEDDPNGPGPDHYWRMNSSGPGIVDIGISDIDGSAIAVGGDPLFNAPGPLINDPTNFAVLFDGQGDYFEIGVDGSPGALQSADFGTFGFFISADPSQNQIIYSQADANASEVMRIGVNAGVLEFFLQTSPGNSATFRSSIEIDSLDFIFAVLTNDGSSYTWYVSGVTDSDAELTLEGTGANGLWFADIPNATATAIAARADGGFNFEMSGRASEVFAYTDEVISASDIATLFEAAVADGAGTATNPNAAVVFEDCIFVDTGASAISAQNSLTDFDMLLQVNRCRFYGGAQAINAQTIRVQGLINAAVRGSVFDMQNETITDGRAAIVATTANPAAAPTVLGSLLVTDCEISAHGRAADGAIYAENGFAVTVENCQITDSLAAAIAWTATAERINAVANTIDGLQAADGVAGIRVVAGQHTAVGTGWIISGNKVLNCVDGILFDGDNSASQRARFFAIENNFLKDLTGNGIELDNVQDFRVSGNSIINAVEGIRIGDFISLCKIRENNIRIEAMAGFGIVANQALINALAVIEGNAIEGTNDQTGIQISGPNVQINANRLVSLDDGISLQGITTAQVLDNSFLTVADPLAIGTPAPTALDIGKNYFDDFGGVALTIAAGDVEVTATYHTITSETAAMADDLDNLGGNEREGRTVALLVAAGSGAITPTAAGDIVPLAAGGAVAAGGTMWFVRNSGSWYEIGRTP